MIALDLETYPIAPGMPLPKPVCYSWCDKYGSGVELVPGCLPVALHDEHIIGLNIAFDMGVLLAHSDLPVWEYYEAKKVTDIGVRQQLADIAQGLGTNRSYSLRALAKRHLGIELEKENSPRLEYHRVAGTPVHQWPSEFVAYARKDAEVTYQIWKWQEENLPPEILEHVHKWEHYETYADFCLRLMSAWGVRADPEWWAKLKADAQVKYEKLCQTYRALGVMREDGTKDKGVLQELIIKAYNGVPPLTDKGQVKTDRLTLEESGDRVLESLTGDGPIEKILTTYGKVIEEACDHPYNSRYNVLVSSGRTSSNFQQWPRGGPYAPDEVNRLRAAFRARPGYVYCSVDFTGAELVSLAQVCYSVLGYSNLRDALNSGQNLHTRLASRFVGCSYEDAVKRVKAKDPILVSARQGAKPVNFGLPGLMGPERLVGAAHKDNVFFCELSGINKECEGSHCQDCLKLAREYTRLWKEEWPEVPEFHNWVKRNLDDPWHTPVTGFLRGGLYASEAANHPFQHLTSRVAKSAMIALAHECYTDKSSVLYGSRPIVFAHDEIIAELPESRAPEAGDRMCKVMLDAGQKWVKDVLLTAEPALMRRWWKGAECIRDASGKLLIWEPK